MDNAAREEFHIWAKAHSDQGNAAISSRAKLRVFPLLLAYLTDEVEIPGFETVILTSGRAIITTTLMAANAPTDKSLVKLNQTACRAANTATNRAIMYSPTLKDTETYTRWSTRHGIVTNAASAAYNNDGWRVTNYAMLAAGGFEAHELVFNLSLQEARNLDLNDISSTLLRPLWNNAPEPGGTKNPWQIFISSRFNSDPKWRFWRSWYQGHLSGNPMNWELQRVIAEIPSADWLKGANHLAPIIQRIQDDFPN